MKNFMDRYYWTGEKWGKMSEYPPENWEELDDQANELLDAFVEAHGITEDNFYDHEDELDAYADQLWEIFCSTGKLPEE